MDVDGEPSASEPTVTPPGSLPREQDLPVEQSELRDIDFDLLTELVSYINHIYVHNMHIFDVLSFLFGSRHRPY